VTCKSVAAATATLKGAGYTVSVDHNPVASSCPAGTVARTNPSGSSPKNGNITLVLSKGGGAPTGGATGPGRGGGHG
jgi:beta-lactam-binding protein with PASTA domain